MEPMQGKLASSQFGFGYPEQFCIPGEELIPKNDVLFITGDWNAKEGSQEVPGMIGKFGLGV